MKLCVLALVLCVGSVIAENARFDNYSVFRVTPTTTRQLAALKTLEEYPDGLNFWSGPERLGVDVDVMVPPHKKAEFSDMVSRLNMRTELFIENVQHNIDMENTEARQSKAFGWTAYYQVGEIYAWLDSLAAKYSQVSSVVGGKTYEGREIRGVKVSYKAGNPGVFIESGIHAREWIGPATVTWILNELLTSTDPAVRNIAENYDWYIFPSTNPDGYEYTHTTNRLWRKTRSVTSALCHGADPNRNWGFHWLDGGSSTNPCSDTYAGSSAFSEIETKTLSQYITSVSSNIKVYLAVHSYGQYLLLPYGHSNAPVSNYNQLMTIGKKATETLAKRYGTKYTYGNIVDILYVASGGSMDWVKGTYNTPVTYTFELRDKGNNGFVLPASQIIPTAQETLDAWVSILEDATNV